MTPDRELADRIAWHEMTQRVRADEAMNAIWRDWFSYYERHFRGPGIAISMADQQAFFEIAQPVIRNLLFSFGEPTPKEQYEARALRDADAAIAEMPLPSDPVGGSGQ